MGTLRRQLRHELGDARAAAPDGGAGGADAPLDDWEEWTPKHGVAGSAVDKRVYDLRTLLAHQGACTECPPELAGRYTTCCAAMERMQPTPERMHSLTTR